MSKLTRRELVVGSVAALTAPVLGVTANAQSAQKHICLVHGAWHGAWAWKLLTPMLIESGYSVSVLDLSGLGANTHRQAADVGLHVHGKDVLNHLFYNDFHDVTVVAHSYGGAVLSEALANDADQRISHAVYLDAFLLHEGESVAGTQGPEAKKSFEDAAANGAMIPPRARDTWERMWGLTGDDAEWSAPRMSEMSARCFTESVQGDTFKNDIRRTYMRCIQNKNPLFDKFSAFARNDDRFAQLDTDGHHNVMVIDPPTMLQAIMKVV